MYACLHMFRLCVHTHTHPVTRFFRVLKGLKCFQQNKLSFARLPEALHSAVWHCSLVMLRAKRAARLQSTGAPAIQEPHCLPFQRMFLAELELLSISQI